MTSSCPKHREISTIERQGGGKVVQPPPAPPPRLQQQQQQKQVQQFGSDQNPRRRLDGDDDSYRRIARTNLPSLSTRERRLAGIPSRPVSVRSSKLRQHNPTRSGFLLLIAAIFTAPSLWSVFHDLRLLAGGGERGSGFGIGSIGVRAADCADGPQNKTVSNTIPFDYSMFACDNGEFNVSWEGVVNISSTIKIGMGTIVRIFGEGVAVPSTDSTDISDSPTTSTPSANNSSADVDLELELEMLSSDLNLPQELASAAVGSVGLGGGNSSGDSFGPIFFVDGGELYLESLAIRRGYSVNSSSNATVNGGGINAINAIVSASSCEFEDNFAYYLGGGIHANLSTLTFKDTIFRRNHAGFESFAGDDDADGAGGGIACENSDLYIDGCLFDDNYANKKGGGVHMGAGRVSVVDSLFFNNLAGSDNVESEDALGEGAAISFTVCTRSFDNQSSCGVNDTTFIYNAAAKKGAAVAVGSGDGPSYIEFHRCVVDNSTTGWPIEDDPQGEGGAFAMGQGTTLVLEECVVKNNYCGKKGGAITLSSGDNWVDTLGATVIMRNSNFTGNFAELEDAGVINVGEYATVRIEGQGNNFTGNMCGADGGVVSSTTNTRVVVEGGLFEGNAAEEKGGVFLSRGTLNITGGNFSGNTASDSGAVVLAENTVNLFGGNFEGNEALDGGVVFVSDGAKLFIQGGIYSGNKARNGGGAFWGEDGGNIEITGGTFTSNEADFGGFLYVEGDGYTSCEGASVVKHSAVDGGAIYAVDGAVVDWACHLVDNEALSGPAIYAREDTEVTVRDVNVSDNVIARGSVIFVVSSTLFTYRVNLRDSTGSSDLSAVQSDSDSTYIAEETAFMGFEGETVVYSEGILYLDDCDFSESSASALVYSDPNTTTVIRNAVLGDNNFEAVIDEASAASELPVNASLVNVVLTCSESGSPCSTGSSCLEGELGVYCQCYVRNISEAEVCLDGDTGGLSLTNKTDPSTTFHPNLLEGDIFLTLDAGDGSATFTSPTSTSFPTSDSKTSSTPLTTTSRLTSGGVIWNISAMPNDSISWTIFPSVGILLPGKNITVRVASLPSADFEDTDTAEFVAQALGAPDQEEEDQRSNSSSSNSSSSSVLQTGELDDGDGRLEQEMEVTYFHCKSGSFWNYTTSDNDFLSCELCTDIEGDAEGLDCSDPGASTLKLPLESGYWRASLTTTVVRECFNEDACVGGTHVTSVEDYCDAGYEGPYCGVCASGYGRGSANACHKCTEEFKGVMYFIIFVAFVLTVVVIVLLAIYLVGGRVAVSQTMYTTRKSVRMLQRRSSGLFLRSEFYGDKDTSVKERSASGGDVPKMSSNRDKMISGRASAVATNPSRTNAPVSASSYFSAAPPATVYAATDEDISGQSIGEDGGGSGFSNSGANDVKVADSSLSSASAADMSRSGRALLSASARMQHSSPRLLSALASVPAPVSRASTPAPARAPAPASTSAQEKRVSIDGGAVSGVSPSRLLVPTLAPTSVGERESGGGGGERREKEEEEDVRDDDEEEEKTAATVIGEILGRLPLSKLKIVIVVWQISSAFAEITEVPFPEVYDKFLSIIGIFSFDLSWILSAACLTVGLDFYDELLIVTIGPVFLLSLLGFTFYLGSRPLRSSRRGGSLGGIINWNTNRNAVGLSSSGATALSTTSDGMVNREQGADRASATGRVGEGRVHRRPRSSISTNTTTTANIDSNIAKDSGTRKIVPQVNSTSDSVPPNQSGKGVEEEVGEDDDAPPSRGGILTRRRSVRRIWKDGPGDDADSEQIHLWWLFARHTTMTLIVLYLVYSTVSTVVFQTFACEDLDEIGKSYLRADFRIECHTPKHEAYKIYAAIMICVYPLGIPLAFWYFLARHKTRINPPMDESLKGLRGEDHVVEKKVEKRKDDPTVAPTSFLWAAYYPDRYYFEVCECIRRLLLTGVLVFISPNTSGQVAFSCLFAFISLVAFELLRPHMDQLDRVLYRTGCLVIFFMNFLALIISADVADPDSKGLAAYAIGLIVVNIFFVILSIWWNTWATIKAMFSERHVQGVTIGLDILGEDKMDAVATAMKAKAIKGRGDRGGEVKIEVEDFEAAPVWERDPSVAEEPIDISRISTSRHYDRTGTEDKKSHSIAESVLIPPSFLGPQAAGAVDDSLSASEPHGRRKPPRRNDTMSRAWAANPQDPSSTTPAADSIFDRGPRSRGFPYALRIPPAKPSAQNSPHATGIPAQFVSPDLDI